jgi:hypothetical protein
MEQALADKVVTHECPGDQCAEHYFDGRRRKSAAETQAECVEHAMTGQLVPDRAWSEAGRVEE